ncbi:MAG: GNAT family N-acetyltransferase [Pseudomonadota bacterium]
MKIIDLDLSDLELIEGEHSDCGKLRTALDGSQDCYKCEGDDGILGGYMICHVLPDAMEVQDLWVRPAKRRSGIARALLLHLDAVARRRNIPQIWLEVRGDNRAAQSLYRQSGFIQTGLRKGYYGQTRSVSESVECDAILMTKML